MIEDETPWGQNIRKILEPALADERKPEVQRVILNDIFNQFAQKLRPQIKRLATAFGEKVDRVHKNKPSDVNVFVVGELTITDDRGQPLFNPVIRLGLPLSVAYTEFSAMDIKEMPGYIALHEQARDLDVAVRLYGVTAEEGKSPSPYPTQPFLVIDTSKTYNEGAMEGAALYPNLPPKPAKFDRKTADKFEF